MIPLEILPSVSRTFTLSIEQLPSGLRDECAIAYLLLRVSDCLEDNGLLDVEQKVELLHMWTQVLEGKATVAPLVAAIKCLDENDPEVYVAQHAGQLLRYLHILPPASQEIIIGHVIQTTLGMARWQEQGPFVNNEDELDDYMHQVAGRVGYLITELFGLHSKTFSKKKAYLLPLARQYGLALQTVNIIRGLYKDFERGWVYVPRTFYEPLGLTRESLFSKENTKKAVQVINMLANKAETHLQQGLIYVTSMPWWQHKIRLACMWPLFFAIQTLALSRDNDSVVLTECKITREDVNKILRETTMLGWSNRWLRYYYNHLSAFVNVKSIT